MGFNGRNSPTKLAMDGQTNQRIRKARLQQELRNDPTDAERELWLHLRGRRIDGAKFRRQHPFGNYILDFACLERRIVVEVDGGQHAEAADYDARRTRSLEQAGFVVLRFWNNEVFKDIEGVVDMIWNTAAARRNPSPPKPSP